MNPHSVRTAFPVPGLQHDEDFNGMTLRDYFAAKAMQGMCTTAQQGQYALYMNKYSAAQEAYAIADAMLAARAA